MMPGQRPRRDAPTSLPPLSRWLLRLLVRGPDGRTVINDLSELYERRLARRGKDAAQAWLRRQVAAYPRRLAAEKLRSLVPGHRDKGTVTSRTRTAAAIDGLVRDLRHSARSLVRTPVLTVTIALTVGLGIGATSALFSGVNAVLIRPLPYTNPGELVRIFTDSPPNRWPLSVADYLALEEQQTSFRGVAGYDNATVTFNRGDVAERVRGKFVTGDYFSLLGVTPLHGRVFNEADGKPESEPTVVVSHAFSTRHLSGGEAAIGQSIRLDGRTYRVVGVLPPTVGPFEQESDFFAAVEWQPPARKGPFFVTAVARLLPGTSRAVASAELRAINRRIFPVWQDSYQDKASTWGMMDLKEAVVGDVRRTQILVFGAVGLLLLIATNNATNLLLARATQRRRELAVRASLGASRGRLVRYMLAESAMLALAGASVGLCVLFWGTELLRTAGAQFIPRTQEIHVDGTVLLFLGAVTLSSGLLFGLLPSLAGVQLSVQQALRDNGRSTSDAAGPRRLRRVLVASQFAIAAPLLIGAGLLAGSLARLSRVEPGFDTHNILAAGVALPQLDYREPEETRAFWKQAVERIAGLPGVEAVVLGDALPPTSVNMINNFNLEDKPVAPGESEPATPWVAVSTGYFGALGIAVIEGRTFTDLDVGNAPPVAVVDRAWANRFFPGESAVGKRFVSGGCSTCPLTTVVGVVSDVKYMGLDDPGTGTVYWPMEQGTKRFMNFLMRTGPDPVSLLPAVRQVVRELDPSIPLLDATTIDESLVASLRMPRYMTMLAAAFALAALMLSVIGIYGVVSHHVQQHTRDIGIHIALGGAPNRVLQAVVWRGLRLVLVGVVIGLAGTLYLTRLMSSMLFDIGANDLLTFSSVAVAMLAVALTACLIPARRAASVDPVIALREE
jgi:putative ABC transport system permease protein